MADKGPIALYNGKPLYTIDDVYSAIHGKTVTIDGIQCTIEIERSRFDTRIMCKVTPRGRRTEAYRDKKRQYKDDWDFDMSQSEDFFGKIVPKIRGFKAL